MLIEEVFENESIGHTTNYLKIKVSEKLEKNELYLVHLTDVQDGYLLGKRKEKVSL